MIYEMEKVALVTPVTNTQPQRGASAVKRVKTRFRSPMKDDLLNSLLMITIVENNSDDDNDKDDDSTDSDSEADDSF